MKRASKVGVAEGRRGRSAAALRRSCVLAALSLGLATSARATSEEVVFGPKRYAQPLPSPSFYVDRFTLPEGVVGPFRVHIKNGDHGGRQRASSAWLFVNGTLVAGPRDFERGGRSFDRTLQLSRHNRVVVAIADQRGVFFEATFVGRRAEPVPTDLTPDPLLLAVGATGDLTATLAPPPRAPGALVVSRSSPALVDAPDSVPFAAGQTEVAFPVTALAEGASTVSASLNGASATATVQATLGPPTVTSLLPPSVAIAEGASGHLMVTLSSAQAVDTEVSASSSDAGIAGVPAAVTVPAGASGASIPVTGVAAGIATITAALNASSATSQVTVTAGPPTVVSLEPPLTSLTLGASTALQLTISAAQSTPTEVALSASPADVVLVPASVVVPAGQTEAPVPVEGEALGQSSVTASLNGSTASALVNVVAPTAQVIALQPESLDMTVGSTSGFTVFISAAQDGPVDIALASSPPGVIQVPGAVTVAQGASSATFSASALAPGDALITAALDGSSRSSSVHVRPQSAALVSLLPNPLPLQVGATGALSLTIDVVQESDSLIALENGGPAVAQVPANVTVPAGALSVSIPVTGLAPGTAPVTARLNATSATTNVEVTPPPPVVTALTPASVMLSKGTPGVFRVAVSRAPSVATAVALSSSDPSVASVPIEVNVPAGALFADFPVASLAVGEATVRASLNGVSVAARVTVVAPELVSLALAPEALTVDVGDTVAFSATGVLTDGSSSDFTADVLWSSSAGAVAAIDAAGVATAKDAGETAIGAVFTYTSAATGLPVTVEASTTLSVRPPSRLSLAASSTALSVGQSVVVTVTASPPAPVGGLSVALLASGSGAATFPSSVLLSAGGSVATFALTATLEGNVVLTASSPGRLPASLALTIETELRIDALVPLSGPVGSTVTLMGTGFLASLSGNQVVFPGPDGIGVVAAVLSATGTQVAVRVPPLAADGPLRLSNPRGTVASGPFTVTREQDFALVTSPATVTVYEGARGGAQVQLSSTGTQPFTGLVSLSAQGLPPGTSASFSPGASLSASQPVTVNFSASSGAAGSYRVTLRGERLESGHPLARTATVDLDVKSSAGVTGIKGRFVTPEKAGIAGVIVRADLPSGADPQTSTDAAGNFQLVGLPAGPLTLRFDATPANPLYPIWPYSTTLPANQITVLPDWTINPPPADEKFTPIANAVQEQVITDPRYPGLEIRLPAGASIIGWDGAPKSRIAIEKVEIAKLPVPPPPTPTGSAYQLYFGTPMGGIPSVPIPVTLPNDVAAEPGETVDVWFFDGSPLGGSGEWKIAGPSIVSADGKTARMPAGTGVPRFCGVCGLTCLGKQLPAPVPPPRPCKEGNPVELSTGQEMPDTGGLSCGGLTPIETGMTYNPVDAFNNIGGTVGSLGFGWVLDYDIAFLPFVGPQKRLVLPGNGRVNFTDDGLGNYKPFDDPRFDGSVFRATNLSANEWELTFRDRSQWRFKPFAGIPTFIRGGPPTFVTEMVDPQGNVLAIGRLANGRIHSIGTGERGVTMTYGPNGFVSEIRDSADRAMQYTYAADDRLQTVTDPDGRVTTYTYVGDEEFVVPPVCGTQPSFGKRLKTIQYPGRPNPTENSYGPGRRVLRQLGYDGREHRFAYKVTGACVTQVASPNTRCAGLACPDVDSWESFEAGWRIYGGTIVETTVTRPDGQSYAREFNARGVSTGVTNAQGQKSTTKLDSANRVTERTDVLGRTWKYSYDDKGNVLDERDPLDRLTRYAYDPTWNKVTSVTRFDDAGEPQVWQFGYDAAKGSLLTLTNPLDQTTQFHYTSRGELERVVSPGPLGQVTRFEYEPSGDLKKVVDPLGNATRFGYDGAGRLVAATDPLGFVTRTQRNGIDRLTRLTDARGNVTELEYDPAGRLASVTNARDQSIESYSYDAGDRMTSRRDAKGLATGYEYDAAGRLLRLTDRRGQVTTYSYDERDRVKSVARPEGVTTFSYDSVGRLTEIVDPAGTIAYDYDLVDRLVREVQTAGALQTAIQYVYDAFDRRISRTVSGVANETTTYGYDTANRLTSLAYRGDTTTFDYDVAGRLTRKTLPNGIRQEISYDAASRPTGIVYKNPDDGVVEAIVYGYDAAGRRIRRASGLGALSETPFSAVYDEADRMTTMTLTATGQSFDLAYDENGNLTTKSEQGSPANVTSYAWDSRNRLVGMLAPGLSASFAYDALGRRTAKTLNGHTVSFVYDGLQAIAEVANGQAIGVLTALGLDDVIARYSGSDARSYLTDALNTVVAQTSSDRSIQTAYVHSPYGETSILGLDDDNPVQYTARENDRTGLYYFRARYYDPVLKRFVSEDPIGLRGGVNALAYVLGNPVGRRDPLGLLVSDWHHWVTQDAFAGSDYSRSFIEEVARDNVGLDKPLLESLHVAYSHAHAMRQPRESVQQAVQKWNSFINYQIGLCTAKGLGWALHAAQDATAPAHSGFPVNHGASSWLINPLDSLGHAVQDSFVPKEKRLQAVQAGREIIRMFQERCGCPE